MSAPSTEESSPKRSFKSFLRFWQRKPERNDWNMLPEKDIKTTLVPGTEFSPNLILTSRVHQFENPAEHH